MDNTCGCDARIITAVKFDMYCKQHVYSEEVCRKLPVCTYCDDVTG